MVEQSGEPLLLSFLCYLPHTVQPLGHALPALCRVHVRLNDVLLRLCPSLPNLRRRSPSFVRLAHRYYGTVRLLQHVHVRIAACGLRGPALIVRPRRAGDLPVLVHVVSQRARVLRLRRTEQSTRDYRGCCVAFLHSEGSRRPVPSAFRSSIARPTDTSVYASSDASRHRLQDSRPGWIRCSPFPWGSFIPYNMPVYPGALRIADIHDKSVSRGQKLSRRASEKRVHKSLRCFSSRSCLSAVVPRRMRTRHPFAVSAPQGLHRRLSW